MLFVPFRTDSRRQPPPFPSVDWTGTSVFFTVWAWSSHPHTSPRLGFSLKEHPGRGVNSGVRLQLRTTAQVITVPSGHTQSRRNPGHTKLGLFWRLLWWFRGKESACQCRGSGLNPWSGNSPHVAEQLSFRARITLGSVLWNKRSHWNEKLTHQN